VHVQAFNEASIAFQTKMVANGGLGQDTYLPEGVLFWCFLSMQTVTYHQRPLEVLSCDTGARTLQL
jgi:hypothetical protein